ncbi:DNA-binding protein [Actinomyces slackii]|uniref:Amino acid permease n=1 Tax=Actinomyces slackii TaxID=52774 RepID=A0A448KDS5_9ACTO|nr:Uncharacterised protein [Actinomyces slackii]
MVSAVALLVWTAVLLSQRRAALAHRRRSDYEVSLSVLGPNAGLASGATMLVEGAVMAALLLAAATVHLAAILPALAPYRLAVATGTTAALALAALAGAPLGRGRPGGAGLRVQAGAVGGLLIVLTAVVVWGLARDLAGSLHPGGQAAPGGAQGRPVETDMGTDAVAVLQALALGGLILIGICRIPSAPGGWLGLRGATGWRSAPGRAGVTERGSRALLHRAVLVALRARVPLLVAVSGLLLLGLTRLGAAMGAVGAAGAGWPGPSAPREAAPAWPVLGQISAAALGGQRLAGLVVMALAVCLLVLAAGSAFLRVPALMGILARDAYLPRQLFSRSSRARAGGIIALWLGASLLLAATGASVGCLAVLAVVTATASSALGQAAMTRYWTRELGRATEPTRRQSIRRARILSIIAAVASGALLLLAVVALAGRGSWMVLAAIALVWVTMRAIGAHYRGFDEELALSEVSEARTMPVHIHALVPALRLNRPTLRALSYAQSTQPATIEALTVDLGDGHARRLVEDWRSAGIPVPLTLLDAPEGLGDPIVAYVRSLRRESPRDLVVVFLTEYLARHWWQQLLHNRAALGLRAALLFTPGVIVATVPWHLGDPGQTHVHGGVRARTDSQIVDADAAARRASRNRRRPID